VMNLSVYVQVRDPKLGQQSIRYSEASTPVCPRSRSHKEPHALKLRRACPGGGMLSQTPMRHLGSEEARSICKLLLGTNAVQNRNTDFAVLNRCRMETVYASGGCLLASGRREEEPIRQGDSCCGGSIR